MNTLTKSSHWEQQAIPYLLTVLVFLFGVGAVWVEITLLNALRPGTHAISLEIRLADIVVGMTIYLKTSIDFALFIGRLMSSNPGWKRRIPIETGTALGNIGGTMAVLLLWGVFRDIHLLMAIMVIVASFVLFRLAEEGFDHAREASLPGSIKSASEYLEKTLQFINRITEPVLKRIVPKTNLGTKSSLAFWPLLFLSFSVPFILGLDDFAGYVPLFSVVNVYGFAIGVFAGHMILNIALFISPDLTIKWVRNPIISLIGSLAFIGLGLWGIYEAIHLFI